MATQALEAVTQQWRDAADSVLEAARTASRLPEDDLTGLSFDSGAGPDLAPAATGRDEIANRVERLLAQSDVVIAQIGVDAADERAATSDSIQVLLGVLEVSNVVMTASLDEEAAIATMGVDDAGGISVEGARAALDEFKQAILGRSVTGQVPLPGTFLDQLEALEMAGAKEIIALGEEAVVRKALGNMASVAVSLSGDKAEHAFEWIKDRLSFLRRVAVKALQWVVNKFRSMVPERFREKFDEKLDDIKEALKEGVDDAIGNALGFVLGRRQTEHTWQDKLDSGADMSAAEEKVPGVVEGHVKRIGYVSTGRKAVSGGMEIVTKVLKITVPQVQLVIGVLVGALFGFVAYQMWDGFDDVEDLAKAV